MTAHERSEVEVKFFQGYSINDLDPVRELLEQSGYTLGARRIETDFLPDTEDGLCKQNKLLLRMRHVQALEASNWLLTLKIRSNTVGFLDFKEIETPFKNHDPDTFDYINSILKRATGKCLSPELLTMNSMKDITNCVRHSGFIATRILLDKYREEYIKGETHVTLDYFPEGMGSYVEVEDYSTEAVEVAYRALQFKKSDIITTDYGDLLKQHKSKSPPQEQRTAIFDDETQIALLRNE